MFKKLIYLFCLKLKISTFEAEHLITQKRILISTLRPSLNHYTEIIIALGLMHIGHKVVILIGNSDMFYEDFQIRNDWRFYTGYVKYLIFSRIVYGIRLRGFTILLKILGIPYQKLCTKSEAKDPIIYHEDRMLSNKHYLASIKRWKSGTGNTVPDFIKSKLKNNVVFAENFLRDYRMHFDLLISSHGIYSLWGPYLTAFENAVIIIGEDVYHEGRIITSNGPIQVTEKNILQSGAKLEVEFDAWLESRRLANSVDQTSFKFENKVGYILGKQTKFLDLNAFERMLDNRFSGLTRILMLPNTTWDGDISERSLAFGSLQEWTSYTAENSEVLVIVRAHPAEIDLKSYAPKLFDLLPKETITKLVFLPGDFFLSSYSLSKLCDKVAIYDSIIGIELAGLGEDVIVSAHNRHYLQAEWMVPKSRAEFSARLDSKIKRNFRDVAKDSYFKLASGSMLIPGWRGEVRPPDIFRCNINWLNQLQELVDAAK